MLTLLYITLFTGFIPLAVLVLLKGKTRKNTPAKPFIYLTAAASFYELVFTIILKIDVRAWWTAYDILAFLIIFYYFYKLNAPKYRIIFYVFMALFALVTVPAVFTAAKSLNDFFHVQAIFSGIITLFVMVMTILWFRDVFKKMEVPNLWDMPDFYYVTGLFIYYSVTFFLFLLSDVIQSEGSQTFLDYWLLNIVAALILRILLTAGVWKSIRN